MAKHPDRRKDIYNSLTVIRQTKDGDLEAIPYHVAYKEFLEPMAQDLVDAAVYSDDPAFSTFLAAALESSADRRLLRQRHRLAGFEESEIRPDPGPLRNVYLDGLLGVKATYEELRFLSATRSKARNWKCFRSMCRNCKSRCRYRWRTCHPSAENNRRWK